MSWTRDSTEKYFLRSSFGFFSDLKSVFVSAPLMTSLQITISSSEFVQVSLEITAHYETICLKSKKCGFGFTIKRGEKDSP